MLSQETRPFVVDGPYSISARDGAPGSQFCVRYQARSIDDLGKIGAIPRFIDVEVVKRAVEKVTKPGFAAPLAERHLRVGGLDGSDGGDLEQHLEVLVSGMVVDTSGDGGAGGNGGSLYIYYVSDQSAVGATGIKGATGAPGMNKTPVLEAAPLL